MANYSKSFNLRNGVQVDNSNFLVNTNGLVGIGSTVPTQTLDVNGNVNISGIITTSNLYSGIATVGFLTATKGIQVSGAVTATTFYGSAAGLTGIYAIAVAGWYVNSSNSTISTSYSIGIGTTQPAGDLQIGSNTGSNIIFKNGDANYTGVISAFGFSGSGAGLTAINASNLYSGTIDNARLPSNISVSGIITALTKFSGDLTGNVTGNVTGIASTARSLTGTPNISVGVVTASSIINSGITSSGITSSSTASYVGTGGTGFTALSSGNVGIGTSIPTSDFQIRKSNSTLLEVISNTSQSRISIGQSVGVGKSTAVLRVGLSPNTFDIINNDTGNINMYLHNGPAGIGTGRFAWLYGQSNTEIASLTYDGSFGIGITNPANNLHVVGTSTVTGNAYCGSNLNVVGALSVGSFGSQNPLNANIYQTVGFSTFNNVSIANTLTVGSFVGIGTTIPRTYLTLDASGANGAYFSSVGVGSTANGVTFRTLGGTILSSVSIGSTMADNASGLNLYGGTSSFYNTAVSFYNVTTLIDNKSPVGIGTSASRGVIDFGEAGKGANSGQYCFMVPPVCTTTQRNSLIPIAGALIYNSTLRRLEIYNGFGWSGIVTTP
jgi:hypothetical protein